MKGFESIVRAIEVELDEKDAVRESALRMARDLVRMSGAAMRGMHRGEDVRTPLAHAREATRRLRSLLTPHPDLWHSGAVEQALQEVSEAAIVDSLLHGKLMPNLRDLAVTSPAYLLGMADAIGELRRFALDCLRAGDIQRASRHLDTMEEIFDALLRFDHPNAIVPLRHKQDVARGLIERTRGELAVATRGLELERRLQRLETKRATSPRKRGGS